MMKEGGDAGLGLMKEKREIKERQAAMRDWKRSESNNMVGSYYLPWFDVLL